MSGRFLFYFFIATILLVATVRGYSSGAPEEACQNMIPDHETVAQDGPKPFTFTLSSSSYRPGSPGGTIQVTLTATGNESFQGFMLQARGTTSSDEPVGYFTPVTNTQTICSGNLGHVLTHSYGFARTTSMTVDWRAPTTNQGNIQFRATVVKNYNVFWTDVVSEVITKSNPSTTQPTVTTKAPVHVHTGESICTNEKGCFQNPAGCVNNCEVQATWQKISDTHVRFELKGKTDGWVALALSRDRWMDDGAVSECVRNLDDDAVLIKQSYNKQGYSNEELMSRLRRVESSYKDGEISCTFDQEIHPNIIDNRYFNLNESYFFQLGTGEVGGNGEKNMHSSNPIISSVKIQPSLRKVETTSTVAPSTSTKAPVHVQTGESICTVEKGCFQNPFDCTDNCEAQATWQKISDTHVRFELKGKTDGWVALALSHDGMMDNGAVSECVRNLDDDMVHAGQSFNDGHGNEGVDSRLRLVKSSYKDGEISCSFDQEIHSSINDKKYFNLNESYFLQLGTGTVGSNGKKRKHSSQPIRSDAKIDTSSPDFEKVGSSEIDYNAMIKAHACLMITAWVLFVSTALILARYFKQGWPTRKLCGIKLWFSLHRACMVCALFITTAGFIIVFVAVNGYSYRHGKHNYDKAHPPLGIIVTALIFINPLMSLARCDPGTKYRPIFNWLHWAVGNIAFILSVVVIFFGMFMKDRGLDPGYRVIWMMVAFVVLHVLTDIVLEISKCVKDSAQRKRREEIEMQKAGMPAESSPPVANSMRLEYVMLAFYLIGTLVLWLMMIIHIGAEIK